MLVLVVYLVSTVIFFSWFLIWHVSFNWSLNVLSVRLGDSGAYFNLLFLQAVHRCLDLACSRWPVLVGCGSSDSSFSGSSCCYVCLLDLVSRGLPLVLAGAAWGSRGRSSWAELLAVGWLGKEWDQVSSLCPLLPCHLWAGEEHPSLAGSRGFLDGTSYCSSALWPVPCTSSGVSGGRRTWGLWGGEDCCGLLLWPGPHHWFFLPCSLSLGQKGDSWALMGRRLSLLAVHFWGGSPSVCLAGAGWPHVARGTPVASPGSWPSPTAFCSQTSRWAARDRPPSPVGWGSPGYPASASVVLPGLGPKDSTSFPSTFQSSSLVVPFAIPSVDSCVRWGGSGKDGLCHVTWIRSQAFLLRAQSLSCVQLFAARGL